MAAFIHFLNNSADVFVAFASSMLIQSSVLVVALLLLDWILRRRVRAVFRYCIWMLVLAKLALPTTLSLPTGVGYWVGGRLSFPVMESAVEPAGSVMAAEVPAQQALAQAERPASMTPQPRLPVTAEPEETHAASAAVPEARPVPLPVTRPLSLHWQAYVLCGWLAILTVIALLLSQRFLFVRSLIRQAEDADGEILKIFARCRADMGVTRAISLKYSSVTASPAVCGLFRPVILIPLNSSSAFDAQHLRSILLHELAHVKRGDLPVCFVQTVLQIVYFYNPLLWLANAIIRNVREQAVDEMVLVAMGEDAGDYPETLLHVSRMAFSRPALSLRLIGVVESKKVLAVRIKHILSRPFPTSAKLGISGLVAVFIVAAVLLPMAQGDDAVIEDAELKVDKNKNILHEIKDDGVAASAKELPPLDRKVFDKVKPGMSMAEVEALLGEPVWVHKGDYKGADCASMWVYCLLPYGAVQSEAKRHPHFWIKFSKESLTVQKSEEFSGMEWTDCPSHTKEKVEYDFPDNFFAEALAGLAPVEIELDSAGLKKELAIWVREKMPGSDDADAVAEVLFEKQVKANILRQLERINGEVHKMLQRPEERVSPGLISFSGPGEVMKKNAVGIKTGLSTAAIYHYFPCGDGSGGRWEVVCEPKTISFESLTRNGSAGIMPISVNLKEFGRREWEEFQPVCKVEVTLKLVFSGRTVGGFSPSDGVKSSILVQPKAILTVGRSIKTGGGFQSRSKPEDSIQKVFAPESLRYRAAYRADLTRHASSVKTSAERVAEEHTGDSHVDPAGLKPASAKKIDTAGREAASVSGATKAASADDMPKAKRKMMTDADLAHFSGLKDLRELEISGKDVTDAGLQHLATLKNLERLSLRGTSVSDAGLAHLAAFPKLQSLSLISCPAITGTGLSHVNAAAPLKVLNLGGSGITDAGLEALTPFTQLAELNLSYTKVTDAGLAHLSVLKELCKLNLGALNVTDDGLRHLGALSKLRELQLGCTEVMGPGLMHLAGLGQLQELSLWDTQVGDSAIQLLTRIQGLHRQNARLGLVRSNVSKEGIAKLSEMLPNCYVYGGRKDNPAVLRPMVQGAGPVESDRTSESIRDGLSCLWSSQHKEGSWSNAKGNYVNASTALAVLAFMVGGQVPEDGPGAEAWRRGKAFLLKRAQSNAEGYLGDSMYEHALATLAFSRMWLLSKDKQDDAELRKALEAAVALIVRSQSAGGGWRYQPTPTSGHDTSVTSISCIALASARQAGIMVPEETFRKVVSYLEQAHDPESGGFHYMPGQKSVTLPCSSGGLYAALLCGQSGSAMVAAATGFVSHQPGIIFAKTAHYYYAHYYAAHAMALAGAEEHKKWYPRIRDALINRQKQDGAWGEDYETALAILILGTSETRAAVSSSKK